MLLEEVIAFKSENNQNVFKLAKKLLAREKNAKVMDIDDVIDPMIRRAQKELGVKAVSSEVRNELKNWFKPMWNPPQ